VIKARFSPLPHRFGAPRRVPAFRVEADAVVAAVEPLSGSDRPVLASLVPALVAAFVLGGLFALVGAQLPNELMGLPRLERLLWVPAGPAAFAFAAVGAVIGALIGALISIEPCRGPVQWPADTDAW
jgi:hypothetical protein